MPSPLQQRGLWLKPSSKLLFGTISNYHNHTLMKVEFVSEQDTQERELILTSMFNCPKCSPCKMTHTVQLLACHIHMGYWPIVRSRWLDIGQVLFFASLWTKTKSRSINSQKKNEPISSHLDWTSFGEIFLVGHDGQSRAGKIAPSCPLG